MKKISLTLGIIGAALAITISCTKQPDVVKTTGTEQLVLPNIVEKFTDNNFNVDNNKATLGKVLFYDKHLSLNNSTSCGSCHVQTKGFSDNKVVSPGFVNEETQRNTPAIQNLVFSSSFGGGMGFNTQQPLFWDNRENDLMQLSLRPIGNHIEMGITDFDALITKLNNIPYYKTLVQNAYGTDKLDANKLAECIANFCGSIRAVDSRFDKFINGDQNAITAEEKVGFQLFNSKQYQCNGCHTSMLARNTIINGGGVYGGGGTNGEGDTNVLANIGLDASNHDKGFGAVNKNGKHDGKFKIPDLHNVALTAPYFHNGSVATLEGVIDHYSEHIQTNPNLDFRLRNADGTTRNMHITATDKKALVAFLKSLTDYNTVTDKKLSNPFVIVK